MSVKTFAEHLFKLIIILAGLAAHPLSAETLRVAVAANFSAPAQEIARAFRDKTGQDVSLAYGSTGKFYAQIQHGATFDMLLAADANTPQRLIQDGLGLSDTLTTYAIGTLVLWSPDRTLIQDGKTLLLSRSYERLAIADPRLAPYGLAARQTLEALELLPKIQGKLIVAENISQAYQFVASGNATLGLIAKSQIYRGGKLKSGSFWQIPQDLYRPILQQAVILKNAQHQDTARSFLAFLKSEIAQNILISYGYQLP